MTRRSVRHVSTVIEIIGLAVWVEVTLRRRPFEWILDQVARTVPRSTNPQHLPTPTIERVIRLVYRLLPFEATCLKHSLIFCVVRRRRGLPGELRIGCVGAILCRGGKLARVNSITYIMSITYA